MGWEANTYTRLRDREWHRIGDLFEAVEQQIPLHCAMRFAMHPGRGNRTEMPVNSVARWEFFLSRLSTIGVETREGRPRKRQWNEHIRLRYVSDRVCQDCGGPVIKASWAAKCLIACLACEASRDLPQKIAPVPVRPISEKTQVRVVSTPLTPGWWYRARRAFAGYLKQTRLPFLSTTRIGKELERHGESVDAVLLRFGKPPLTRTEFNGWVLAYFQRHPP